MNLIDVLLRHTSTKTDLEKLKSRIQTSECQIATYEKDLATLESDCQTKTRLRDEFRIKRDVAATSTNNYSKQSSQYADELKKTKANYAEYDSWWWKLWYPGRVKNLKAEVDRIESAKRNVDSSWTNAWNELCDYKNNIEECEKTLSGLESSKTAKKNSLTNEKSSKEKMILNELKSIRDRMLDSISTQIKSDRKSLQESQIAKTGNESEIKSTEATLERLKKEINNKKSLIDNCNVIINSYKHTIKNLKDKVNKLKESLKNLVTKKQKKII